MSFVESKNNKIADSRNIEGRERTNTMYAPKTNALDERFD